MRIVTWNCCRGAFARKVPMLEAFKPDVIVVQECAKPVVESPNYLWFGKNPKQGVAVQVSPPYQIRALPILRNTPKYVIPVSISGPREFTLFAVWTLGKQKYPYVEAAAKAIDIYCKSIAGSPAVFIGDFNSNTIWDAAHSPKLNHSSVVERLANMDVVSAYHHNRNELHGHETEPTYYFLWKKERPFHIDYCFIPKMWADRIVRVEIGSFEDWREYSDHRPLLVEVADDVV